MKIMNIKKEIIAGLVCCGIAATLVACCSEWEDYYEKQTVGNAEVEVFDGDVKTYMTQTADVSTISSIFQKNGIYDSLQSDRDYTLIVADNAHLQADEETDMRQWANYCVSDMSIAPTLLQEGFAIKSRSGKAVWVTMAEDSITPKLDDYNIVKTVKANNGYIYYIDGQLSIRPSVYEYLKSLGDDYSRFRNLVCQYDTREFDKQNSTVIGVGADGRVKYDSVFVTENSFMDRYTDKGIATWNMRDEHYLTTMFLPTNDQIDKAISDAMSNVELWLGREATDADRKKFEQWIVKACFVDKRLGQYEVNARAADFYTIGGYIKKVNSQTDVTTYESVTQAYWKPSVQNCRAAEGVMLSNGMAYTLRSFKIPNHVVIYRVKSRFYQLWDNMKKSERNAYFRWQNLTDPQDGFEFQSSFTLSESLPTIEYYMLTAVPDEEAMADSTLTCAFTFDGLTFDEDKQEVSRCYLPAGEYYLRMGFYNRLNYTVSFYFNGRLVRKNMSLGAQGSNFHFDRGAASDIPRYGEAAIAYPEDFDVDYWQTQNAKAIAYDTDGYTVAKVVMDEPGYFNIRVESKDLAALYKQGYPTGTTDRSKGNTRQFAIYHWCLRPTVNNY